MADNEAATPAWGALPVEKYLIRNWDPLSELSTKNQRDVLVAAYIEEDVLGPGLLASPPWRVPTATEITEILEPWRSHKMRRIAAAHLEPYCPHSFYILRSYYGGGAADDARVRAILDLGDHGPDIYPENEWFCVLDDKELFNFPDDWQEVYSVLPELAAPRPDRRFTEIATARDLARITPISQEPEDEDYEDAIMFCATAGVMWLLVLDQQAFETNELRLILRDLKGNTVKESTITPDEAIGAFHTSVDINGMLGELDYWVFGTVGKKYRTRGKIMRELLRAVKGE
ncbi:hypothetical protein C8A00DRAFT_45223 [Chaetomidium leptoderma]|uniref:Uncharacterized protein n=1 Tax=Chaetomidium leptoderma TaxID=669021 RepID=A0AAN6VHZ3_9PEZI|nr:hypothetical protein C8A00DRAFT_45223 [Chaetomidium leptoderma]